jgi:hypothetical protein
MRGMRLRLPAVLAVLGLTVAGAVTQGAGASGPRATAGRGFVPGSAVSQGGPIHGMVLVGTDQPLDAVVGDIPRLAADGVNLVSIYVTEYIDSPYSSNIHSGRFTPTDQELEQAIELAHANGMAVQLAPTVWMYNPYVWRGAFKPADVGAFFANYRAMMDHYAELAASQGVELLTIGSEYSALDGYSARWVRVAREVRLRFSGLITYMATTQHLLTIRWWRAVDLIGVSPYYPLSQAAQPTYGRLVAVWQHTWLPMIQRVSEHYGRPVLFDEIGYLSALGTTREPWMWKTDQPASQQAQATAYAALLDAVDSQAWLRGVVFFQWGPPVGPSDRSFNPRDKIAECVLAEHWASPDAPIGPDGHPAGCLGGELASDAGLTG